MINQQYTRPGRRRTPGGEVGEEVYAHAALHRLVLHHQAALATPQEGRHGDACSPAAVRQYNMHDQA